MTAGYLLDTHVFVWLKTETRLIAPEPLKMLMTVEKPLYLSAVSAAELYDKGAKGGETGLNRLLSEGAEAFAMALEESSIESLPLTLRHAAATAALPLHHRDPFDRLLIGQALAENLVLVSRDSIFSRYHGVKLMAV